jgi:primosomal protein N' (replication factor Y)
MLPASATKVTKETILLTAKGKKAMADQDPTTSIHGALLRELFGKRQQLTKVTFQKKLNKLSELTPKEIKDLGLVTTTKGSRVQARSSANETDANSPEALTEAGELDKKSLTPDQQAAFDHININGLQKSDSKPFLLHGVTGSGKTEVYLQLIEQMMLQGEEGQALVLVPEISLTPQMTQVFERRFPGQVAVVHSAMSDPDRWEQLGKIRSGSSKILIGPRSAVFGPFKNLKLLMVDEEHDSSYKQSTGLTYNGRDVAILRAKWEGATIVLGSATPSMESYHNAQLKKYDLVSLPQRVTGRPLPEVEIIESQSSSKKGQMMAQPGAVPQSLKGDLADPDSAEIPIDPKIVQVLKDNQAAGHQAIVLVNRRGYAYYLFSIENKQAIQCPECSVSMTLHTRSTVLRCHYCDYKTSVEKVIAEHPGETLVAIGYGSEKAEEALRAKLPGVNVTRLDSDAVVKRDLLPEILQKFRQGEIDILVGTQILAKGHDFPNVTLIAILDVDQLLNLPDFRAGERTFQLLVQASGRAGRADLPGRVMIQTSKPDHEIIRTAIGHDYLTYAANEYKFRQNQQYPPFTRMIAFEFNGPDRKVISQMVDRVDRWFEQMTAMNEDVFAQVRVLGPAIPPIETIRGRHRRMLILSSEKMEPLRQVAQQFAKVFKKLPSDLRMKIDVDPQSLI